MIIGTDKNSVWPYRIKAKSPWADGYCSCKRGTIYDRNGAVIAEDATTYNVYAVIDKKYKSATGKILYVEESQFKK